MSSGDWFDSSEINKTLCMVVNKAAQNYFDTSYAVGNVESSLSLLYLTEVRRHGGILILFLTKHQNITMKMLKVSRQVPYLMTII